MSLTHHDKQKVLNVINSVLGNPDNGKPDEHIYYCPFCHHHKKKMNINIENQKWHCWVCDAKGKSINSLLRKLNIEKSQLSVINQVYKTDGISGGINDGINDFETITKNLFEENSVEEKSQLFLPKEFRQLSKPVGKHDYTTKRAISYLKNRGITENEIKKYNIGFCPDGLYKGRVIIPSYDDSGQLNYFIARTIYDNESFSYKNPTVSRDIIALGNQINWNEPIVLVEGIFDAIAVKRNAIPLFGKVILPSLMELIFTKKVKDIIIMLDVDAQKQALRYTEYFNKQGINTKNIVPSSKDAGEMGFSTVNHIIKTSKETEFGDIISQKLKNI